MGSDAIKKEQHGLRSGTLVALACLLILFVTVVLVSLRAGVPTPSPPPPAGHFLGGIVGGNLTQSGEATGQGGESGESRAGNEEGATGVVVQPEPPLDRDNDGASAVAPALEATAGGHPACLLDRFHTERPETGSAVDQSGKTAFQLFDGSASEWEISIDPMGAEKEVWIDFEFASPVILQEYRITSSKEGASTGPTSWILYGADTKGDTIQLDSRRNFMSLPLQRQRFIIPNVTPDQQLVRYRFVLAARSTTVRLADVEFWGCQPAVQSGPALRQTVAHVAVQAPVQTGWRDGLSVGADREWSFTPRIRSRPQQEVQLTDEEEEVARKLMYWRPAPERLLQFGRLHRGNGVRYVTFDPDVGAFNNKRHHFENAIMLAMVTGRVLVLPPERVYAYGDYWQLEDIQVIVDLMAADVFIQRQDHLCDCMPTSVRQVLEGKRLWDGKLWLAAIHALKGRVLYEDWKVGQGADMVWFPKDSVLECDGACRRAAESHRPGAAINEYNATMQRAEIVHFPGDGQARGLAAFTAMFGFQDPEDERMAHLMMRNHVHLRPVIFRLAAKVVARLGGGKYGAMHIRRGDFQYDQARLKAADLLENVQGLFDEGTTLYIATDEKDRAFFGPLLAHYDLKFFRDYPTIEETSLRLPERSDRAQPDAGYKAMFWSPDYSGMVESVVCSYADKFVGTYLSTFSTLIFVVRGYHKEIEDKNIYVSTTKYGKDEPRSALLEGVMGVGFHWQANLQLQWKYNSWAFDALYT